MSHAYSKTQTATLVGVTLTELVSANPKQMTCGIGTGMTSDDNPMQPSFT